MGAFEYSALDTRGREKKGVLEGDSPRQIRQQLREKGLLPVSVDSGVLDTIWQRMWRTH